MIRNQTFRGAAAIEQRHKNLGFAVFRRQTPSMTNGYIAKLVGVSMSQAWHEGEEQKCAAFHGRNLSV